MCTADGGHGAPAAALFFQQLHARFPVGEILRDQRVESGGVVMVANMRKLVDDDIVDGLGRIEHEPPGKANAVFTAA